MLAGYGRALGLCSELGLTPVDLSVQVDLPRADLVIGGERMGLKAWETSVRNPLPEGWRGVMPAGIAIMAANKKGALEGEDWSDPAQAALDIGMDKVLKSFEFSDAAVQIGYNTNPNYGVVAGDVSLLNMMFVANFFKTQMAAGTKDYIAPGGNSRLPEALASWMGARSGGPELRFHTPVAAVVQDARGVEVRSVLGEVFRAGRVVCALPLGPLGKIAFEPALPALHREAAAEVPYMKIRQVHLVAETPFWEGDGLPSGLWSDEALGVLTPNRGGDGAEITSFTAWGRGAVAAKLDAMPAAEAEALVLDGIGKAWPAAKGRLRPVVTHSWARLPYQGGAWAVWKPGQATRLPRAVGAVLGRVHFCGEHSALSARGMEGALESAERVAVEVLLA